MTSHTVFVEITPKPNRKNKPNKKLQTTPETFPDYHAVVLPPNTESFEETNRRRILSRELRKTESKKDPLWYGIGMCRLSLVITLVAALLFYVVIVGSFRFMIGGLETYAITG